MTNNTAIQETDEMKQQWAKHIEQGASMTKQEFKSRWERDDNGGGINFDDIAECAVSWGLSSRPKTSPMDAIRYRVLKAAKTCDAEDYAPNKEQA